MTEHSLPSMIVQNARRVASAELASVTTSDVHTHYLLRNALGAACARRQLRV
jgi:hypothetical protein